MRILFALLLLCGAAYAELKHVWATEGFLKSGMKIIDIRTPGEWRETGIVEGSHTIMFFDEQGRFDVQKFLSELDKVVKKDEQFAIICRTGSRTFEVGKFLGHQAGYNVINLAGGIEKMMQEGYKPVMYLPQKR
jgi:rhodanese-related sulfurtransferase